MADLSVTNYERALDDITQRGISAIRSTQRRLDSAVSNSADAARRTVDRVEKVRENAEGAILHAIKVRPYTTLVIAGLIGFACAAPLSVAGDASISAGGNSASASLGCYLPLRLQGDDMSLITAAVLASGLLVPSEPGPASDRQILALNPQPEPPGRSKIKRIYTGGPDSRRNRNLKTNKQQPNQVAPAAKY